MLRRYSFHPLIIVFFTLFVVDAYPVFAQQEETDTDDETAWNLSVRSRYQSTNISRGVDLSEGQPAWGYGLLLIHESGFSGNTGATVWSGKTQNWFVGIGFEYDLNDLISISLDYTHTRYQNDSLNTVANLSNILTFDATLDLDIVDLSVSYDRYFGDGTAAYFGASVSGWFRTGDFTFLPSVDLSFVSQDVTVSRLSSKKGPGLSAGQQSSKSSTVSLTGMSGITLDLLTSYNLGKGFSVSLDPMYVISKAEISTRTHQFLWIVGLRYSIDF
ncbi:MAG: hypothetical protein WBD36_09195 [Bacteroidota bacterium]